MTPDMELALAARAENIAIVRHAFGGLGEAFAVSEQKLSDIRLAETVQLGHGGGEHTEVRMTFALTDETPSMSILPGTPSGAHPEGHTQRAHGRQASGHRA
jgi:hypothetical protein